MPGATLAELLERNARHVESLSAGHFDTVQTEQHPAVVSVCCSDSRVSQEGMWAIEEPGWLFSVGNIGNQVTDQVDGADTVCGDVLYPLRFTDTDTAVVVGHTGCGAVTAALEAVRSDEPSELPPGIKTRVESLRPVIEAGLDDDRTDPDADAGLVNQLVEYNVDQQVEILRNDRWVQESVTVFGFVYDFQAVYDDVRGRCYLINLDGETGIEELRRDVPARFEPQVRRLLK